MLKPIITAALAAPFALLAVPSSAQDAGDDKVNMVIVYGEDACPQSTADQITVCARKDEGERYRIPENLRFSGSPENTAWAEKVDRLEMVGSFGALSCSPTGAGGFTGCTQQMLDAAYQDRAQGNDVRFAQLIDEARKERLSAIDSEAAGEQARVEQIEREYMERIAREGAAETPGESAEPLPQPTPATPPEG